MSNALLPSDGHLSPLKRAFLALEESQQRVSELEGARSETIAIVGVGCRFPGAEDGPADFWRLLSTASESITSGIRERFGSGLGQLELPASALRAGLLNSVDLFDPRHFGISPKEAVGMDPQQRLLLEVSWEAFEHAAIDPTSLYQSRTGVYLGLASHDYAQLQLQAAGASGKLNPHSASGAAASVAAGRLSYFYGFNGPSIAIDTACSSSLVAVHLACEALRHGDCTAALAGGVNLILAPEPSIAFAQAGMLSGSGSVRAFDASADGFVRGEGCGVVVLKRLSDAESSGDRILAVIVASAVNQDGASSGLTVPNGLAQQALLREAHLRAGVEPWQVGYVEAHGTGTPLGDPIEAQSLSAVFGTGTGRATKLQLGSVKTNIGHLESAAGIAGLIKVVLALEHKTLPPQLHFERPSKHLRWDKLPLEIVTALRPWEPIAGRHIAGVSSFGFSGTNAHVVLEGWPQPVENPETARDEVLVISARTAQALRDLAGRYATMLLESKAMFRAICSTAATGRTVFGERLAVVAASKEEAAAKLRSWQEHDGVFEGVHRGQVGAGRRGDSGLDAAPLGAGESSEQIAAAFVTGETVNWAVLFGGAKLPRVELPTYAFERERYWIESTGAQSDRMPSESVGVAMLGRRLSSAGLRGHFETTLDGSGWIGEHRVEGRVVLPATGHLELMLEAGAELFGSEAGMLLEEAVLESPLVVGARRLVQVVVEEEVDGRSRVRLYAQLPDDQVSGRWQRVSEGWLIQRPALQPHPALDLEGLRHRLSEVAAGEPFYGELAVLGVDFGSCFRALRRGWRGAKESLGEIVRASADGSRWQLEPWWFDACLQVAALAQKEAGNTDLYLPLSLERLEVYARRNKAHLEASTWSHVTLCTLDSDTISADITVADEQGQPIVRITKLRFRKLKKKPLAASSLLFELAWQPTPLIAEMKAEHINQLAGRLEARFGQIAGSGLVKGYGTFFAELEALAADYVLQCFASLAWPVSRDGQSWSIEQLSSLWHVMPQYRRLLARLIEITVETGVIRRDENGFQFGDVPPPIVAGRLADMVQRFPMQQVEVDLVVRCGAALAEVITGKIGGHELVFPAGQSDQMAALYAESVPARIYNQMVAEAITALLANSRRPSTSILEVGGGTGAATQYVLEALKDGALLPEQYLFTDISPLLVRRARDSFEQYPCFASQVFDLERSPQSQGIDGKFSIILAVNVMHATSNLSATLNRLRSLLAADGVLVAVEVTGKQRWADITVGLLDGWWSFSDTIRTEYPTLPGGAWRTLLAESGFREVVSLPSSASAGPVFGRQELLLARAPAPLNRVLVVGEGDFALRICEELRRREVVVSLTSAALVAQQLQASSPSCVLWMEQGEFEPDRLEPDDAETLKGVKTSEASYRSLLITIKAITVFESPRPPRLYIATSAAFGVASSREPLQLSAAAIAGFAAGIAMEAPQLRCTRLDCSRYLDDSDVRFFCDEITSDSDETWVGFRSHERYVARLHQLAAELHKSRSILQFTPGGGIDSLEYVPIASHGMQQTLAPHEIEIEVHATSLNFRDVLQVMGAVDIKAPLGSDCAGVLLRVGSSISQFAPGDEVVAIAPGAFGDHVVASSTMLARKPVGMSFAQAAAQAVAYLTAYFALHEAGRLRRGERVLIHAAAGGVGLAAVHLCRRAGAVVLATAGSERKRKYLQQLGVGQVLDSRSGDFTFEIIEPVDVVLNSLAGNAITAGLRLLNPGGRFLELGKTDLRDPQSLDLHPGVEYLPVDLTPTFAADSPWVGERLSWLLGEIASGSLPALPIEVFPSREVKQAFRYMARAEHIGRVVVQRKSSSSITGTHMVTGGLRGIGLEVATFLAAQGASELVLVGRSEPSLGSRQRIAAIEASGTPVRLLKGDIGDVDVAGHAIALAGPKLRGIWHCAGTLANASLLEQTWETFEEVARAKIDGAWNLHRLTLKTALDYFVLFSSWASIAGSIGQANHCAANTFLDGLAHRRRLSGLTGMSLNWGAWMESGAASSSDLQRQLQRSGMSSMLSKDALDAMQAALSCNLPQVAVAGIDWLNFFDQHPAALEIPLYRMVAGEARQVLRNAELVRGRKETQRSDSSLYGSISNESVPDRITALNAGARKPALSQCVAELVRKTLDLRPGESIDPDLPLAGLGMDSLLAIELRNRLTTALKLHLPSTLLFDQPTLRSLDDYLYDHLFAKSVSTNGSFNQPSPKPASTSPQITSQSGIDVLEMIEQMSDQEVDSAGLPL